MAAAAATAAGMGPSFAPTVGSRRSPLKCLPHRSNNLTALRSPFSTTFHPSSLSLRRTSATAETDAPSTELLLEEDKDEAVLVEEDEVVVNTKLYFGNLPYNVDSSELAGLIQDHATPELIEVLYDRVTGKSRGFAFVTMSSIEDCNTVVEKLDGTPYMGRILRVNFSDKPKPKEPLYPETENKLFVGNLSWSVTSESLTKVFQEYGNVVGARVLYDGESGQSRGYGFVSYATKAEMDVALESLNGMELEGRAMRVSLAEGKRS